jgi:hypothetical protein
MVSTPTKTSTRGFGYQPDRSGGYHFEVKVGSSGEVTIIERYSASAKDLSTYRSEPLEKARIGAHRWSIVQGAVAEDFNRRLQQGKVRTGSWGKTTTPLAPHYGKELVLLAWAIEDQDPTNVPRMLANWRGLAPEERWWFYTTINASSRHYASDRNYGWRAAIKIAFLDDPQDIGLSALRVTGEEPAKSYDDSNSHDPDDDNDSGPIQGRLFAEPNDPGYKT